MNYNYENTHLLMEGAELLYTMLHELIGGIKCLPGCKETAPLKRSAANVSAASEDVYQTMKNIALDAELSCDENRNYADECGENDIHTGSDLQEFLGLIENILSSDKPVSISADIYINEEKDGDADSIEVESEEL